MSAIAAWLKVSQFGAPRFLWAALTMLALVEWALGRSKNPRARSLAAAVATVLRFLVVKTRLSLVPVVGPLLVAALEYVAGTDLDGDGKVAGVSEDVETKPLAQVPPNG